MAKNLMRILLSAFFWLMTVVLVLLGKYAPPFIFQIYIPFSRGIMNILAGFFSVFPVAIWEILALAAVIFLLYTMVRDFSDLEFLRWFTGIFLAVSVGVFAFMALWGMNYYAPSVQEQLDMESREYSVQELRQAAEYYRDMANKTAGGVKRDEDGAMIPFSFQQQAEKAADGYRILEIRTDEFVGSKAAPKRLLSGRIFALGGATGVFVPFTGECCVSDDVYCSVLPFAMCLQLGRRLGYARQEEAEFAAFLACVSQESPEYLYSGYFVAFSYCYNALYAIDEKAAVEVWKGVSRELRADCLARISFENGRRNETANALRKDLAKNYYSFLQNRLGAKKVRSITNLMTMWYFEKVK
jgi:hypothetical protein